MPFNSKEMLVTFKLNELVNEKLQWTLHMLYLGWWAMMHPGKIQCVKVAGGASLPPPPLCRTTKSQSSQRAWRGARARRGTHTKARKKKKARHKEGGWSLPLVPTIPWCRKEQPDVCVSAPRGPLNLVGVGQSFPWSLWLASQAADHCEQNASCTLQGNSSFCSFISTTCRLSELYQAGKEAPPLTSTPFVAA